MSPIFIFTFLFLYLIVASDRIIVEIEDGKLEGRILLCAECNQSIYAFEGIPYARPPVNELRFALPEETSAWNGIKNAQNKSHPCIHLKVRCSLANALCVSGSEDCLYLNVYSKGYVDKSSPCDFQNPRNYPVLVVIPGMDFSSGSTEDVVENPSVIVNEGVVLVTFNYRVGPFGFLSSDTSNIPGNYGLHDQILALQWVKNNIETFGGSPEKITIMGSLGGAVSVHYLIMSPLSKGLFQKAISQTGTALCPWTLSSKNQGKFKKFCEYLMCSYDSCLSCLRELPADQIALATSLIWKWKKFPMYFLPNVDSMSTNPFLPDFPIELLSSGRFNHVPWLLGLNEALAVSFIASKIDNYEALEDYWNCFDKVCPVALNMNTGQCNQIKKFYYISKDERSHRTTRYNNMMELLYDRHFVTCMDLAARLHSFFSPVFFYVIHYGCSIDIEKLISLLPGNSSNFTHGLENYCLFDTELNDIGDFNKARKSCETVITTWINFIKYGYPTPSGNFPSWPLYQFDSPKYYFLTPETEVKICYRKERMELWNNLHLQWTFDSTCDTHCDIQGAKDLIESPDCLNKSICPNLDIDPMDEKQVLFPENQSGLCYPATHRLKHASKTEDSSGQEPFLMKYSCTYPLNQDSEDKNAQETPCSSEASSPNKCPTGSRKKRPKQKSKVDNCKEKEKGPTYCCIAFDELVAFTDPGEEPFDDLTRKYETSFVECGEFLPEECEKEQYDELDTIGAYESNLPSYESDSNFKVSNEYRIHLTPDEMVTVKSARQVINKMLTQIILSKSLKANAQPVISLFSLITNKLGKYFDLTLHDVFVAGG